MKTKEFITNTTVIGSFLVGWGLTIAGFCVPPCGIIDNTVLIVLGQALTYCGGGLGLKSYLNVKLEEIKNK